MREDQNKIDTLDLPYAQDTQNAKGLKLGEFKFHVNKIQIKQLVIDLVQLTHKNIIRDYLI